MNITRGLLKLLTSFSEIKIQSYAGLALKPTMTGIAN